MEPPAPQTPKAFKVREGLDGVLIDMPRRVSTGMSGQTWMLMSAGFMVLMPVLFWMLPTLALVAVAEAETMGLIGVALILLIAAMIVTIPPALFYLAYRMVSAPGRVRLKQRTLRLEGRKQIEVPLETVERIEIHCGTERGFLRFITQDDQIDLFDGLFIQELEWLAGLIRHHAGRYRQTLTKEGHDVQAVAQPPQALIKLVRR
ncbi:MAG: hypothetical protein AAFV53_31050 [Myxococcota bacterium]